MSTEKNDAAHPVEQFQHYSSFGLTKREYFAAMAMQQLVEYNRTKDHVDIKYMITDKAVTIADELIKSLNQTK